MTTPEILVMDRTQTCKWKDPRASLVTLVKDIPQYAPLAVTKECRIRENHLVDFNIAVFTEGRWSVDLSESLSPLDLSNLPAQALIQYAHQFSDAVIFLCEDLNSAITTYLAWLECCGKADLSHRSKPGSSIIIQGTYVTLDQFIRHCSRRPEALTHDYGQLKAGFFDSLELTTGVQIDWAMYRCQSVALKYMQWEQISDVHKATRRLRMNRGNLWCLRDFQSLVSDWHRKGQMPNPVTLFTEPFLERTKVMLRAVMDAMIGSVDSLAWTLSKVEDDSPPLISVVCSYLARHSFASRHWTELGENSRPNLFAYEHFELRYQAHVREFICKYLTWPGKKQRSADPTKRLFAREEHLIAMFRDCWFNKTKTMYTSCQSAEEATRVHIESLVPYQGHLSKIASGIYCAACFLRAWDHILPCAHRICTLCLRACKSQEMMGCRVKISECPVCRQDLGAHCVVKYDPPTAPKRVLALDGGGIKGIIQLEILNRLLKEMRLGSEIHLTAYFDLIVGTSIGGISALGLGKKVWRLEECKEKFFELAQEILGRQTIYERFLSWASRGWFRRIKDAFRITFFDSIYESAAIESVLQKSFGNSTKMIEGASEHETKVAVVVNEAAMSKAQIFPTYNNACYKKNRIYDWPAKAGGYWSLKAWEAARASSAAPSFWAPIPLLRGAYQDGGLSFNNPSVVAQNEIRLLTKHDIGPGIIVSVGCGRFNTAPLVKTSVFRRLFRVFDVMLDAEQQHANNELLNKNTEEDIIRLNPKLELREVSLDDISSLSTLERSAQHCTDAFTNTKFLQAIARAANKLIANLFYLELDYKCIKAESRLHKGLIRTRLAQEDLDKLRKHYPDLTFLVKGEKVGFSIPKEILIPAEDIKESFTVELVRNSCITPISGSPFSIEQLRDAQSDYLPPNSNMSSKRKRT